jgi:hypothetical protein
MEYDDKSEILRTDLKSTTMIITISIVIVVTIRRRIPIGDDVSTNVRRIQFLEPLRTTINRLHHCPAFFGESDSWR